MTLVRTITTTATRALALTAAAPQALAAPPHTPKPTEPQTQLNTDPAGEQRYPRTARLADGAVVATWNTASKTGDDRSGLSVRAMIRNADGSVRRAEFTANATTDRDQGYAEVAALADGGFVIAYNDASGSNGRSQRVRWFDRLGNPQGGEVVVNTAPVRVGSGAVITALADGGVASAWISPDEDGHHDVVARILDRDHGFRTPVIAVPEHREGGQSQPAIAQLGKGRIVVAWGGAGADSENGQDSHGHDSHGHADSNIYMRSMDSAGRFLGGDVRVNRKTEGSQSAPKMASLHNNRAVIAWQDFGGVDGDGSGYVHTVLDSQARPMLGEQPSYPASEGQGYQGFGGVTDLNDGGYVVTWEDRRRDWDVKMQRFGPNARPKGEVVTLAEPSTGRQQFPALAGGFKSVTAVWQDFGGTGSDKESSASIGRTFRF